MASPNNTTASYPMRRRKNVFRHNNWLKIENSAFFIPKAVECTNAGVAIFESVLLWKAIFRLCYWIEHFLALERSKLHFQECTLSEMKFTFLQSPRMFRPISLTNDIVPHYDWLKTTKPRPFVADHLCYKKAVFSQFQPVVLQRDISAT